MKYQGLALKLSEQEREQYNTRIISGIVSKKPDLTREEIYNYFTGKGSLHHLKFKDFENYYRYSEAKKAIEKGQFFTPHKLCQRIISAFKPEPHFNIADLTCGKGNFFNFFPNEKKIYGCELDREAFLVCKHLFPEAKVKNGDFIYYSTEEKIDLIIGNPPFNLKTEKGLSQWAYIMKAEELLKYGGLLGIIVPKTFLTDDFHDHRKIKWLNDHFDFVLQSLLPNDSFDADIDTKLLILQKKGINKNISTYQPNQYVPFEPGEIYTGFIQPIYEANKANATKLHLFTIQHTVGENNLSHHIKKRLWHIKSNPILRNKYYKKALQKLEEIKHKKKPKNLDEKEWEKIKPTPLKVLKWMIGVLKNQNNPAPVKQLKIVKTSYGIKYKAYHKSLKKYEWEKSMHDLLLSGERFEPYKKLYDRKLRALSLQNNSFTDLHRNKQVDQFLDCFQLRPKWKQQLLFPHLNARTIRLNEMQKVDLGLIFQKRYDMLAWEQGGGKSVAGMTWLKYWNNCYKNAFIVAPAIAVKTTWFERLSIYGFDFLMIESVSDISKIKPGQIVLISFERLVMYERFIKKFIKCLAYKIALLVDESDELTNPFSQRTQATINCFRKAKLKLLTTGTTTRNNINELYPQLELVYNNSSAFICWAENIYRTENDGSIYECENERYGYPFPAFHGVSLFKASFCPQRITVFGIRQDTQDVYNASLLKEIINKTIVTRKFEEIVGEKKYSVHTHSIKQNDEEKALYTLLMKDFIRVCYDYYTSTSNSRKDAAMRLIRQIKALIKATSVPHLMKNYLGSSYPEKYRAIANLIETWPNELITIGTTNKTFGPDFSDFLSSLFPDRKTFYINGENDIDNRIEILKEFKYSQNGLLICTQQSLKSSVNIPYCNKCIIESLQWNIPKMSQFYFRFIRFDSIKHTEVHFVNYSNTIEINLLALLMAKEKLNDFIKTTNEKSSAAIYEQFGIDLNILDMLITKEYDSDGKLMLRWGKQVLY